jgi:toxin ParE1/3/4
LHQIAPEAEEELFLLWRYLLRESGNVATADRVVYSITQRYQLLQQHPHMGRRRADLASGLYSFPVGNYIILYRIEGDDIRIVHVFHGSRDIAQLM